MKTDTLELEGLYLVMASLIDALRDKGPFTSAEIAQLLDETELMSLVEAQRLSQSHLDAVRMPARLLRAAAETAGPLPPSALSALVGETRPMWN